VPGRKREEKATETYSKTDYRQYPWNQFASLIAHETQLRKGTVRVINGVNSKEGGNTRLRKSKTKKYDAITKPSTSGEKNEWRDKRIFSRGL